MDLDLEPQSSWGKDAAAAPLSSKTDFAVMFSPLQIRNVALRNRLVFQPHFTALGGRDGLPSEGPTRPTTKSVHEAAPGSSCSRARPCIRPARCPAASSAPGTRRRCRATASRTPCIGMAPRSSGQLTHGGHTSLEHPPQLSGRPRKCRNPRAISPPRRWTSTTSARRSRASRSAPAMPWRAASTGVEIKVAHDGLLRSFASPFFNRRTDGMAAPSRPHASLDRGGRGDEEGDAG